ncbi:MAG: TonB-dependent receptor [bacterium]
MGDPPWPPFFVMMLTLGLAATAHAEGRLSVFVFDGAAGDPPLAGATVAVGEQRVETSAYGRAWLTLPGGEHLAVVTAPAGRALAPAEAGFTITPGDTTELLVTLFADAPAVVDREQRAPGGAPEAAAVDPDAPTGTLEGRVTDPAGAPIAGAQLYVRGRPETATTGADGRYRLDLPEGPHAISVIHPKFRAGRLDATVTLDATATVDATLEPAGLALDEYVVTAPYIAGGVAELSAERRGTGGVVDVLGAEQMSRAGDSSAAGALKRVTGLTIVGGKYIYVRGMGERYSATTLNGMFLPSPEPERRVVPLDIFPTGVLGSVVVQKTTSPDVSAEFGGGVVQLRTRGVPEEAFVEVSASVEYQSGTTFTDGLGYAGGSTDWLGIDDGARALPAPLAAEFERSGLQRCAGAIPLPGRGPCVTQAELDAYARALPNVWEPERETLPPGFGLSVAAGDRYDLGPVDLGVTGSLGYGQGFRRVTGDRNSYALSGETLIEKEPGDYESTTRSVDLSGIFEAAAAIGDDHRLALTTLLLRNTDDLVGRFEGVQFGDENNALRVTRLQWVERQLLTQQVRGEHQLPLAELALRWHYGFSRALRLEPNRRTWQYDRGRGTDEPFGMSAKPEANRRFFSTLDDDTHELALALRLPIGPAGEGDDERDFIELGGTALRRARDVESLQLHLEGDSGIRATAPIEELLAPANIGADRRYVTENDTQLGDSYAATLGIEAAWLMGRYRLPGELGLMAGLRVEHAAMRVESYAPVGEDPPPGVLDDLDWLPSASLVWGVAEDMQLRAGYGRSINRPEFREKAALRYDDVIDRRSYKGNPAVERALIDHFDLRWEWYLSPRESASVAVFYKRFDGPIEQIIEAGSDKTIIPDNTRGADNLGVELDARKQLGFFGEWADAFYLAGNLALIRSSVDTTREPEPGGASLVLTSKERPLQGQSPYVLNLQLGYEDLDGGAFATLLYNVAGPRIVQVGTDGLPDVFEVERHVLDVVAGLPVGEGFELRFKAQNLLNAPVREAQGTGVPDTWVEGRTFSLGVKWSL